MNADAIRQRRCIPRSKSLKGLEHRMGFEPMNTGFADQRVSHFAIGAHCKEFTSGQGNRGMPKLVSMRCPMFRKGNLYFADWRDRKGVRHRKSFNNPEAASVYESAKKAEKVGKTAGRKAKTSRPVSPPSISRKEVIKRGPRVASESSPDSFSRRSSLRKSSGLSIRKSTPRKAPSHASVGRRRCGPCCGGSKNRAHQG
jgi:hypothetical protein